MADEQPDPDVVRASDDTLLIEEAQLRHALAKLAAKQHSSKTRQLDIETGAVGGVQSQPANFDTGDYLTLPQRHDYSGPKWLIALHSGDASEIVMRLKIVGDVVLGVERQKDIMPDLDLRLFLGEEKGVSRRHAVLRPAQDALYLIPLQSTNGTRLNRMLLNVGSTSALLDNDIVSLGALSLVVKVLAGPQEFG
jgi:hypothetical protein